MHTWRTSCHARIGGIRKTPLGENHDSATSSFFMHKKFPSEIENSGGIFNLEAL